MFEEFTIDLPALRIAARRFGCRHGPKLLGLHGWLDNCASFTPIAPYFADHDLVLIDLPGHGRSSHRPESAWYHFIDYCSDVLAVVETLGWRRFSMLGHSLGGAIACLLAAALGDRIERLYLIEALGPISTEEDELPALLAKALSDRQAIAGKRLRRFASLDEAVAARCRNREMPLDESSARLLVERGTSAIEGGYVWSSDPRLTITSMMRMTESMVLSYLAAIRCPVHLVIADPPMPFVDVERMRGRMRQVKDLRCTRIAGSHHLHMEQPAAVAAALRRT